MEKKKVTIGHHLTVAGVTLIPVIESSLSCWNIKGIFSFFGVSQPVSIVAVSTSEKKAFSNTGEEVPLGQLIREVPGIKGLIDEFTGS